MNWMTIPNVLANTAYKIFSDKAAKQERQKQYFADLVARVADCVQEIAISINNKERPVSQCAELTEYLKRIQELAAEHTDQDTSRKLFFLLHHVEAVPGFAVINLEKELAHDVVPLKSSSKRVIQVERMFEVSGMIRAISNLMRV